LKKNALIIGYGSIGKRHHKILKKLNYFKKIFIQSKRNLLIKDKTVLIKNLKEAKDKDIAYIVVASRTEDHLIHIKEIEKYYKNLNILVEKPIFEKFLNINVKKNKYFVGYNLRFHPIILYLKKYLENKKIVFFDIKCTSFLPCWRKKNKYFKSNSSGNGGGALLELSHEVDYAQLIFGTIKKINYSAVDKISSLKVKKDDIVVFNGKSIRSKFSIHLNLFSHYKERKIIVYLERLTIISDLIKNEILFYKNHKIIKKINFKIQSNDTYIKQHKVTFLGKNNCNFKRNLNFMKLIDNIKK
tara:strand:+ start:9513 stop:10412 length:900 start_codon:yes stop_codon:yes gene_type:complete